MSNKNLGRGLKSLIPDDVSGNLSSKEKVINVPVNQIDITDHQPRKLIDDKTIDELAASIKSHGIIQPIVASKREDGNYHLIAGQRRLMAAKKARLTEIPAIIKDTSPNEEAEMALIENVQREDLNPLEEAQAYKNLSDRFNLDSKSIAEKVGKGESTVINSMRLLSLANEVKSALAEKRITAGHARALITLSREEQVRLLYQIIKNGLTVRDVELKSRVYSESKEETIRKRNESDEYINSIALKIKDVLGTKISIKKKGKGGKIIIDYYSKEELERLISLFFALRKNTQDD